jgi:hypothetical protein
MTIKKTQEPAEIPVPRELLMRIQCLELTLLPKLKGAAEKEVREIIWAAYFAVKRHNVEVEDQSKNGVRVVVRRYPDGTTVEASCDCFGTDFRTHSNTGCPNYLAQRSKSNG